MIGVRGTLVAKLTQSCVITLEPVKTRIEAPIQRLYGAEGAGDETVDLTLDSDDPPDPIIDGEIDLGSAVAEQLALEIDPFPRAPGTGFGGYESEGTGKEQGRGPFAVLDALKDKLEKKS